MIDDELISKMMENTLRFGVYGKVEQRRRQLNLFSPSHNHEDDRDREIMVESPSKGGGGHRDQSINMTKGGMSIEEMELLRKENAELMEEIKKMREGKQSPQLVNTTGCCATTTCIVF